MSVFDCTTPTDPKVVLKNTFVHVLDPTPASVMSTFTRTRCFSDALHLRQPEQPQCLAPTLSSPVQGFAPIVECLHLQTDSAEEMDLTLFPTTAMVRNVPNKYTPKQLVEDFLAVGFKGAMRFFYMPFDLDTGYNLGFAFADFVNNAELERFKAVFNGVKLPNHKSHKICEISAARIQGLQANLDHLSKGQAVRNLPDEFKPIIFNTDGTATAFPPSSLFTPTPAAPPAGRSRRFPPRNQNGPRAAQR